MKTVSRYFCLILMILALTGCDGGSSGGTVSRDLDNDGALDSSDCAPEDATRWKLIAYKYQDNDSDRRYSFSQGELCTAETLPIGYEADEIQSNELDCNDEDFSIWRMVAIYQDIDSDGVGSGKGTVTCVGELAPYGYSIFGYDPLDTLSDPDAPNITDFDIPSSTIVVMESDADSDDI